MRVECRLRRLSEEAFLSIRQGWLLFLFCDDGQVFLTKDRLDVGDAAP
ncbi:hypothetical protein [Pelosinus propionicus]|nr:hypothetical protein [Pelosinus propionicus]